MASRVMAPSPMLLIRARLVTVVLRSVRGLLLQLGDDGEGSHGRGTGIVDDNERVAQQLLVCRENPRCAAAADESRRKIHVEHERGGSLRPEDGALPWRHDSAA